MSPMERSSGGGGGGGFTNPMTTKGDIIIENAVPAAARLAIGTTGQALEVSSGGLPAWQSPPGFELDYVENTAGLTVTAVTEGTANTYITGNAVTYDGATRVLLEFYCANITTGGGGTVVISIFQDGSTIGWVIEFNGGGTSATQYGSTFLTPSAASHTYTIRAWKTGGTAVLTAKTRATLQELPSWYRITVA